MSLAVRHYVYVIVDKRTRKLLEERAYDDKSHAETYKKYFHPKGEVVELRVFKR